MAADHPPEHGHVRAPVAFGLATAAFVALLIFALGMTSLFLDQDVIPVRGLGQAPGIVGTILAVGVFAGIVWLALRQRHPSYWVSGLCAVAVAFAYAFGVWIAAVAGGADLAAAAVAAGGVLTSWFGVVIAASALICSWGAIALVRTSARRPRWPWEDPDDE